MAGKRGERVLSALNDLSSDSLFLPGEEDKVKALIGEYSFTDSTDESRCDESNNELVIIYTFLLLHYAHFLM